MFEISWLGASRPMPGGCRVRDNKLIVALFGRRRLVGVWVSFGLAVEAQCRRLDGLFGRVALGLVERDIRGALAVGRDRCRVVFALLSLRNVLEVWVYRPGGVRAGGRVVCRASYRAGSARLCGIVGVRVRMALVLSRVIL
jgi:hypothetical protein